ncbi:MAG: hypothetical protein ABR613_11305, partial [Actinomycetota bacterium]
MDHDRFRLVPKAITVLALAAGALALTTPQGVASFPGNPGRIAVVAWDDGYNVYTMEPDGSDFTRITEFTGQGWIFGVEWSPDGRKIVFGAGDDSEIYT